jgi:hypothetical protein
MRNLTRSHLFLSSFYSLLYFLATSVYAIDTKDLIKVTPENNPKCVEFYTIKGDLYCSLTALQKPVVDPELKKLESMKIMFDERPWELGWGKEEETLVTLEYVPKGQDIEHWNELVTSQTFSGPQVAKVTPKQFADFFIEQLQNSGFKPIISLIEDTKDRVIFEFRIESPENQVQDELQMITKKDNKLYVLHYVIKQSDMGKINREKWINNLKNSSPIQ